MDPDSMDSPFRNMENLFRHYEPLPREFPVPWRVSSIGYVRHKSEWLHRRFSSCNFSFILSGSGLYRKGSEEWAVHPPCVITQWPGELVAYGPNLPGATWEELYLIYPAGTMDAFRASRLVEDSRPVWPVQNPTRLWDTLAELQELAGTISLPGTADRLDRLCERMILETLVSPTPPDESGTLPALHRLRRRIEARPGETLDWASEARRLGMSDSTFRRRWIEHFGAPPGQTLQDARIRRARRLLAETQQPIKEIAAECGFEDPLYFSRRFREVTGVNARGYRRQHGEPQPA